MSLEQVITYIIQHADWVVVAIIALIVFRKPISSLLKRPIRLRRGDFLMELNVPYELQEKIYEDKALFEASEDRLNFKQYLDLAEAFTFTCGLLAGEYRNQPELKELQQLAENCFNNGVNKIQEERPETDSLVTFRTIEKLLKSPPKIGWTYRPLHEVIREKREKE